MHRLVLHAAASRRGTARYPGSRTDSPIPALGGRRHPFPESVDSAGVGAAGPVSHAVIGGAFWYRARSSWSQAGALEMCDASESCEMTRHLSNESIDWLDLS